MLSKTSLALSLLILTPQSFASEAHCSDSLQSDFIASENRPITLTDVEVYRQNNNFGQQQKGSLEFYKWIDLGVENPEWHNTIGLTKEGRVFHVVQSKNRRIGRLLSGTHEIKELFLYQDQILVVVDSSNRILLYSPIQWLTSPLRTTFKKGLLLWSGSAALAMIGIHLGGSLSVETLPEVLGYVSTLTGMSTFFAMVHRFDQINTLPDGLKVTTWNYVHQKALANALSHEGIEGLKQFFSKDHFAPPDLDRMPSTGPESAQEEIR